MLRFQGNAPISLPADPNLNLLGHAQMEERYLGSQCGGHGRCGRDRVQVLPRLAVSLFSEITEAEKRHLSAKEIEEGWRLACQCWPESDQASAEITCPVLERDPQAP